MKVLSSTPIRITGKPGLISAVYDCSLLVCVSKKASERKGEEVAGMEFQGDMRKAFNVFQSLFSCLCRGKINKLQHTGML